MVNILSEEEIKELLIANTGLGLAFTILFFGGSNPVGFVFSPRFIPAFVATAALVGMSFIPHEMAHRSTARVFEAYAEFKLWMPGVVISILTSFLGFVFAAPGGIDTHHRDAERYGRYEPHVSPKHLGLIASVGPLMNISIAVLFAFLAEVVTLGLYGVNLLVLGATLNAYLATFNMLPVYPLDGYKVLRWSPWMWLLGIVLALLTFLVI